MTNDKAAWTVLVYIAAHNDLDVYGQRSLAQIQGVGSTPQVRLAALYDGAQGARRVIAGEPGQLAVEEDLGDYDSGDPAGLVSTARWAYSQCPAQRYGLVLWSHGTGWKPAQITAIAQQVRGDNEVSPSQATERSRAPGSMAFFRSTLATMLAARPVEQATLFDDGTGHSLDTLQLEYVTSQISAAIGQPIDLLGMDACLMATLEIAYQVRATVRYVVASEELVPTDSWPYDQILGTLRSQPDMTGCDLAALVVQDYLAYYAAHPPQPNTGDVTQVALDLARIGDLAGAASRLADALDGDMAHQADTLYAAQYQCQQIETRQGTRKPSKFKSNLWDLRTVARRLAGTDGDAGVAAAAQALSDALQPGGAVVAEAHAGAWFDGLGGLSVYLMAPSVQRLSPYYGTLAFAKDTSWYRMLQAYHTAG